MDEAMRVYAADPDTWLPFAAQFRGCRARYYVLAHRSRASLRALSSVLAGRDPPVLHEVIGPRTSSPSDPTASHPRKLVVDVDYHGEPAAHAVGAFDHDVDALVDAARGLWGAECGGAVVVLAAADARHRGVDGGGFHAIFYRVTVRGVAGHRAALQALANRLHCTNNRAAHTARRIDHNFGAGKTIRMAYAGKEGDKVGATALVPYRCAAARLGFSRVDVLRLSLSGWFDRDLCPLLHGTVDGSGPMWSEKQRRVSCVDCVAGTSSCGDAKIDQFVRRELQRRTPPGHVYRVRMYRPDRSLAVFSVGGNRFCENVGRVHSSNHVKIVVDKRNKKWWWECYGCVGYRSRQRHMK